MAGLQAQQLRCIRKITVLQRIENNLRLKSAKRHGSYRDISVQKI